MTFPIRCSSEAELRALLASGALAGRALHLTVLHDLACSPSRCGCSPEFVVEELTAENWLAGMEGEERWRKGCAS